MKRLPCSAARAALTCAVFVAACSERPAPAPTPAAESAQPPAQPAPAAPPAEQPAAAPTEPAQPAPNAPGAPERKSDPRTSKPGSAACGDEDQPPCPLQGWMERNLQKSLDDGDFARLAQALARVPKLVPDPGWNDGEQGWSKLAQTGVAAAKAKDGDAVEQACKSCHKAWRRKYKQEFRLRPVSD